MGTIDASQTIEIDDQNQMGIVHSALPLESFKDYYIGTILRPGRTFEALLSDNRQLRFGLYAILINTVLYTLVYIFLTIGGSAPLAIKPWLAIPAEVYYYYNRFLLAPSLFMC